MSLYSAQKQLSLARQFFCNSHRCWSSTKRWALQHINVFYSKGGLWLWNVVRLAIIVWLSVCVSTADLCNIKQRSYCTSETQRQSVRPCNTIHPTRADEPDHLQTRVRVGKVGNYSTLVFFSD